MESANDNAPAEKAGEHNDTHAAAMAEIRGAIAVRWERISSLMSHLGMREKPGLTQEILDCKAVSTRIREEIRHIASKQLPHRTKAGELAILLEETELDVMRIEEHRNVLFQENSGLIGAFFEREKFGNYYAHVLDFETRKRLAAEGLLRAADTFDPALGALSTYAFRCMKTRIFRAAKENDKHTKRSLDAAFGHGEDDAATLLSMIPDRSTEEVHEAQMRRELFAALAAVLETLPVQWKRSIELLYGINPDRKTHTPAEAADIMHDEGLRTIAKNKPISPQKVGEWAKQAKRAIAKKMTVEGEQKKEGDEE